MNHEDCLFLSTVGKSFKKGVILLIFRYAEPTITCLKSAIEALEKDVKYIQINMLILLNSINVRSEI